MYAVLCFEVVHFLYSSGSCIKSPPLRQCTSWLSNTSVGKTLDKCVGIYVNTLIEYFKLTNIYVNIVSSIIVLTEIVYWSSHGQTDHATGWLAFSWMQVMGIILCNISI